MTGEMSREEVTREAYPFSEMSPAEKIKAWAEKHRVQVDSTFVPCSQSRNREGGEWEMFNDQRWSPTLNWKVRVMVNREVMPHALPKLYMVLETDYSAGSGNCPAYKASIMALGGRNGIMRADAIAWECEHGSVYNSRICGGKPGKKFEVNSCDVLSSLILNSTVLDFSSFEEWASEFGYDKDSRKAEAIYNACLVIALKLRNGLGEQALAELREACQDY